MTRPERAELARLHREACRRYLDAFFGDAPPEEVATLARRVEASFLLWWGSSSNGVSSPPRATRRRATNVVEGALF